MKVVSLCTGYGGLELALSAAGIEHELAGVADPDPAATAVLATRFPGVPNLGDVTTVDWAALGEVDGILAGYPCQGFSLAGQRLGEDDERFIWPAIADAVRILRPRFVVLENVAGHRSLGFGRVLGDLAAIRYDACWVSVRASDIGAAHRRERVFILAFPAGEAGLLPTPRASDTNGVGHHGTGGVDLRTAVAGLLPTPRASANENRQTQRTPTQQAGTHGRSLAAEVCTLFPTPDATHGRKTSLTGPLLPGVVEMLPTPTAAPYGHQRSPSPGAAVRPSLDGLVRLLPTPTGQNSHGNDRNNRGDLLLPGAVQLLPTPRATDGEKGGPNQRGSSGDLTLPSAVQPRRWGPYEAAVARWEQVSGRTAPEPTQVSETYLAMRRRRLARRDRRPAGMRGSLQPTYQLSPRFTEWLMGLADGWVCDVPGLSRNEKLRLLGNGIVPQQGAHAIRLLAGAR